MVRVDVRVRVRVSLGDRYMDYWYVFPTFLEFGVECTETHGVKSVRAAAPASVLATM